MCTVELLDAVSGEKLKSIHYMTAEERHFIPFKEFMEACHELRNAGNAAFQAGDYKKAAKWYLLQCIYFMFLFMSG